MIILYDNINNYNKDFYDRTLKKIKTRKRNRIEKMTIPDSRKRSILGEYLLMKNLNKINLDYNKQTILTNRNGKPYFKNNDLYYSISHSNDYVICVISKKKIGVDIEKNNNLFDIKEHTIKEAFIKMKGKALLDNPIIDENVLISHLNNIEGYTITICEENKKLL